MADTDTIAATLLSDLKRDFDLTNEQAAGVVGNLMHESAGFNTLQEISPVVPGSRGGFGYGQWTGERRKAFDSYVKSAGLDPNSYAANYGFLRYEIQNNPYERRQFMTVKKADTAAEAARLVSENYLRPGVPRNASRVRLAEEALGYADMPIPPGELPGVGTALDTERAAPAPAIPSIAAAQLRGITSPTGGDTALQVALNAEAAKRATAIGNRVQPQIRSIVEAKPSSASASDRARGKTPMYNLSEGGRAAVGLSEPGNLDLNSRKVYVDGEGGYRTENSMSISTDRGEALIPTVVNGRQLSEEAASQHYLDTGENLGMFKTPEAADRYAENLHLRQEQVYLPKADSQTVNLTDPGAINSIINVPQQDATLAAALARRVAPPTSISDRVRGNEAQTRNVATTIASFPTSSAPMLASLGGPARLPDIAPSSIGQAPTTRVVPTQPVVRQNTNISTARAEQAAQRQPVTSLPSITAATSSPARSAPPQSIIERSPAQSYPNQVRSIADMETTQRSPSNRVDTQPTWAEFNTAMTPARSTPIALSNVMTPQAPRIDSIGSGASWNDLTGTMAPKSIAQPFAPVKAEDRLQSISALSFNPQPAAAALPTKPQLEAATGFRTVTQDKRITNPEWTAYRAANPAQASRVGSPVPLGEMTYTGSRDAKAAAQAGQQFVATQMPAQFITVKEQVRVPVAAPKPAAVAAPIAVRPQFSPAAPTPVSPFAPMVTAQHPILGILGAITGNRGPNTLLSSILGAAPSRPPVGAALGIAGNGGTVTQGYNGPMNSITQSSDAWKKATGQEDRYTRSGDGRFESASGGTYYDRHIN